jgi:hypothetical protein
MIIPRNVLALRAVADTNSTRYALGGICLEREERGPVAVATDGRRMLVARWTEENAPPVGEFPARAPVGAQVIVPADACSKIEKMGKATNGMVKKFPALGNVIVDESKFDRGAPVKTLAYDGEHVHEFAPTAIEGRFPLWRDVVDASEEKGKTVKVSVNALYLAELLEAAHKASGGGEENCAITLEIPADGESAIVLRKTDGPVEVTGLLMPLAKD